MSQWVLTRPVCHGTDPARVPGGNDPAREPLPVEIARAPAGGPSGANASEGAGRNGPLLPIFAFFRRITHLLYR